MKHKMNNASNKNEVVLFHCRSNNYKYLHKKAKIPRLHVHKWPFLEGRLYPANQSNLKAFKTLWLAGKKPGL